MRDRIRSDRSDEHRLLENLVQIVWLLASVALARDPELLRGVLQSACEASDGSEHSSKMDEE